MTKIEQAVYDMLLQAIQLAKANVDRIASERDDFKERLAVAEQTIAKLRKTKRKIKSKLRQSHDKIQQLQDKTRDLENLEIFENRIRRKF